MALYQLLPCQSICSVLHSRLPGGFSAFLVGLLKCSLFKDFRSNLLHFFAVFSYTLAYDTVSIKFDFVSIWLSMDEYIEGSQPQWCISSMIYSGDTPFWLEILDIEGVFSLENCSRGSFTCMLQHSKPTKTRADWC